MLEISTDVIFALRKFHTKFSIPFILELESFSQQKL